jgi:hypothetical protein
MKIFALLTTLLLVSSQGFSKGLDGETWLAGIGLGMGTHKVNTAKFDLSYTDVTIGYVRSKGLYLGGIYGTGGVGDDKYTHFGASLGYALNGWELLAHYLLGGTYDSGGSSYEKGTGTQFDIGYLFKTGSSILIGIQYTSRDVTYKLKSSSTDLKVGDSYLALKIAYPF